MFLGGAAICLLLLSLQVLVTTWRSKRADARNEAFFRSGVYKQPVYSDLSDPTTWDIPWGREENYVLGSHLGKGEYGSVKRAHDVRTGAAVAVKIIHPVAAYRVFREMDAMLNLKHEKILRLVDAFLQKNSGLVCFVMNFEEGAVSLDRMKVPQEDVRLYLHSLLEALAFAKQKGWMHRDVSPENVMIAPERKHLVVIDWGLARRFSPEEDSSIIGSFHYTAPEMFLKSRYADYAADVWSVGIIFAEWLLCYSEKAYLFDDNDKEDEGMLEAYAIVLGSEGLYALIEKEKAYVSPTGVLSVGKRRKQSWLKFRKHDCAVPFSKDAIDLLDKLLTWDPTNRITAEEALKHPYFRYNQSKR
jgi:serine/threonine protein kinase